MPLPVRFVVVLPSVRNSKRPSPCGSWVSLARQRSPMDVIIVQQPSEDASYHSAVWEDNRQAVDWLSGLFPQPPAHYSGTELFPDQARYIRASRLTLHLLDLTDGHPRNMGLLRQRGLDYAATLTRSHSPADVLVLSADADCLYGPRFCQSLIRSSLAPAARMLVLPCSMFRSSDRPQTVPVRYPDPARSGLRHDGRSPPTGATARARLDLIGPAATPAWKERTLNWPAADPPAAMISASPAIVRPHCRLRLSNPEHGYGLRLARIAWEERTAPGAG